ncbi:hypothetical protein H8356DRAFT_1338105 [Neocallimastix lanati (nom. inval.)]|nr:hypothetical protein H8356DRAFT_1338105 [Neocallimastix sp. JGI-2020a]
MDKKTDYMDIKTTITNLNGHERYIANIKGDNYDVRKGIRLTKDCKIQHSLFLDEYGKIYMNNAEFKVFTEDDALNNEILYKGFANSKDIDIINGKYEKQRKIKQENSNELEINFDTVWSKEYKQWYKNCGFYETIKSDNNNNNNNNKRYIIDVGPGVNSFYPDGFWIDHLLNLYGAIFVLQGFGVHSPWFTFLSSSLDNGSKAYRIKRHTWNSDTFKGENGGPMRNHIHNDSNGIRHSL